MNLIPSRLALSGIAAGAAALLSACVYDPGTYPQQPYGQAYGGAYAQPDSGQYGYADDTGGGAYYAYAPAQDDTYLPYVADSDVVLIGGDTYIWLVGPGGQRYRRFYEHGDHRTDVFHRRDEIRANGGWHGGNNPNWHGGGNQNNWRGGQGAPDNRFQGNGMPDRFARPNQPSPQPAAPGAGMPRPMMPQQNPSFRPAPQNQPAPQPNFVRPNGPNGPRPGFNPGGTMDNRPRQEQRANPQVRPDERRRPDQQP